MKVLVMAASLRKDSLHKKLAALVAKELGELEGVSGELVQFNDFEMPLYNFDDQQVAFPAGADALKAALDGADAVVFAVPEYNYSIPGAFKNAIDWLSRYKQNPLKHKPILLMGGSPGMVGGNRGLWQTRIPIEGQLAFVYPDMFGIGNMHNAFHEQGHLAEEMMQKKLVSLLGDFCKWAGKLG